MSEIGSRQSNLERYWFRPVVDRSEADSRPAAPPVTPSDHKFDDAVFAIRAFTVVFVSAMVIFFGSLVWALTVVINWSAVINCFA